MTQSSSHSLRRPAGPGRAAVARGALTQRVAPWLIALGLVSCRKQAPEPEPIVRSVRSVVLQPERESKRETFSGAVRAGTESRLAFQVPGRVRQLSVKVGQKVARDALIATLDPIDFTLQLNEASASLEQARARGSSAEASYERVRKLYANNNASRQDLDNARSQRDAARSATEAASQAVARLRRQLGYATLRAPAAGTISRVDVEENEVVAAGRVVAVLQVGRQLDVAVDVPESLIGQLELGSPATISIQSRSADAIAGTVFEIGVPGRGASVFPISVRLGQIPEGVRAGMAAEVTFEMAPPQGEEGLLVPASAVGEDAEGRFVFVVEAVEGGFGVVRRRPVEVASITSRGIALRGGLEPGDRLVTAGVSRIHDGLRVRVPPPPSASTQPSSKTP